jgi:hypothetical protein
MHHIIGRITGRFMVMDHTSGTVIGAMEAGEEIGTTTEAGEAIGMTIEVGEAIGTTIEATEDGTGDTKKSG